MALQEASGTRLQKGGDYGRAGCRRQQPYEVGDHREFWVSPNIANMPQANKQIDAVLAVRSKHGYVWVESNYYVPVEADAPEGGFVTQSEAAEAGRDWDKIYNVDRSYFGLEPHPDVAPKKLAPGLPADWRDADCDDRVHILNFPIDSPGTSGGYVAGYYSSEHEYPNGDGANESPFSNEAEMFFMNSALLNPGDDTYGGVLAHEFFHMIQFGNDFDEETWVNEGMADVAAVVNGFGDVVEGHVSAYEDDPDQHLFDWDGDVADYGQAFLFFDYLFNHYGAPEREDTDRLEAYGLAKLLTSTPQDGAAGITKVLRTRSATLKSELGSYYVKGSFRKVYADYVLANRLDLPEAAQGQYGYANRDVQVATAGTGDQAPADATVHPYGADYYEVQGEGRLTAEVQDPVPFIPAKEGQPTPEGGYFTWSNRGDSMTSWMQRRVDLRGTRSPTLQFKHWYQIEPDWDYGYVRVSEDGGNTFEFVDTTECGGTATDPNGNNRAAAGSGGITGDSGGWNGCSLDLGRFAGKPVVIRFEYNTDQAFSEPGWVIDDVKLTDGERTLWKRTDFETARSTKRWQLQGEGLLEWKRLKPDVGNQPLVQVVSVSGDQVVRTKLRRRAFVPSEMGLKLKKDVPVLGDTTLISFSALTPLATDPFFYTYTVSR